MVVVEWSLRVRFLRDTSYQRLIEPYDTTECPNEAYIVRANCRDKRKCNTTYATAHATRQGKASMEKFQLRNTDLIVIANEFIALRGKLPDNFKKNLIHPALQRHINWPK